MPESPLSLSLCHINAFQANELVPSLHVGSVKKYIINLSIVLLGGCILCVCVCVCAAASPGCRILLPWKLEEHLHPLTSWQQHQLLALLKAFSLPIASCSKEIYEIPSNPWNGDTGGTAERDSGSPQNGVGDAEVEAGGGKSEAARCRAWVLKKMERPWFISAFTLWRDG